MMVPLLRAFARLPRLVRNVLAGAAFGVAVSLALLLVGLTAALVGAAAGAMVGAAGLAPGVASYVASFAAGGAAAGALWSVRRRAGGVYGPAVLMGWVVLLGIVRSQAGPFASWTPADWLLVGCLGAAIGIATGWRWKRAEMS